MQNPSGRRTLCDKVYVKKLWKENLYGYMVLDTGVWESIFWIFVFNVSLAIRSI